MVSLFFRAVTAAKLAWKVMSGQMEPHRGVLDHKLDRLAVCPHLCVDLDAVPGSIRIRKFKHGGILRVGANGDVCFLACHVSSRVHRIAADPIGAAGNGDALGTAGITLIQNRVGWSGSVTGLSVCPVRSEISVRMFFSR